MTHGWYVLTVRKMNSWRLPGMKVTVTTCGGVLDGEVDQIGS